MSSDDLRQKSAQEVTEPLAVASGTKTQPTVITTVRQELEIKIQRIQILLVSLSRPLRLAVLYQALYSLKRQTQRRTFSEAFEQ